MKALQILIYIRRNKFIMDLLDEDSINEAIAELEALQQVKSCESCEHWKVRNKLVRSNECFKWSGSVMTPRDFCCNRYEAKEQ